MWTLCSCSTSPEVEVVVRPPQPRQHLVVVQGVVPHDVKLDSEHWSVVTLLSLTPGTHPGLCSHWLTAALSLGRIQASTSRDSNLLTVGSPRGWGEAVVR